ncbi:hypothetical protein K402DRAFT_454974 [Aulographum hederae CBS 113979]|uniref:Uncharacterized protein n=1 Tax=Aulographum hederae CBS 113979 TaxID=1176131 RepID=A0A6G1GXH8_9PEZI|nr:hypothetical protein K402DRAFT_454974 [Aulographum hederae CBS 113979]
MRDDKDRFWLRQHRKVTQAEARSNKQQAEDDVTRRPNWQRRAGTTRHEAEGRLQMAAARPRVPVAELAVAGYSWLVRLRRRGYGVGVGHWQDESWRRMAGDGDGDGDGDARYDGWWWWCRRRERGGAVVLSCRCSNNNRKRREEKFWRARAKRREKINDETSPSTYMLANVYAPLRTGTAFLDIPFRNTPRHELLDAVAVEYANRLQVLRGYPQSQPVSVSINQVPVRPPLAILQVHTMIYATVALRGLFASTSERARARTLLALQLQDKRLSHAQPPTATDTALPSGSTVRLYSKLAVRRVGGALRDGSLR